MYLVVFVHLCGHLAVLHGKNCNFGHYLRPFHLDCFMPAIPMGTITLCDHCFMPAIPMGTITLCDLDRG